jgi:predicted small secreted protein
MKLRWWIVGTIAVVASGVLVMKHCAESKEKYLRLVDNNNEKNYDEFPADIYESEFEGTEFLI